jgi:hypothetical protein
VELVEAVYELRKTPEDFVGTPEEYTRNRVRELLNDYAFAKDPKYPVSFSFGRCRYKLSS